MIFKIGLIFFLLKPLVKLELFESPCPDLFQYTVPNNISDEYFGTVVLLSNTDLMDVWMQLTFHKQVINLVNPFGEVVIINGTECFIEKPNFKLEANISHKFSFILKYSPEESPPLLTSFKLNGKLVCGDNTRPDFVCGSVKAQPTEEEEFPWYAALYLSKSLSVSYICGASLISKHHVITVARCVTRSDITPDNLVVYLGKYYEERFLGPKLQDREVSKIIPHPQYNGSLYTNDIALVKFKNPAEITDSVRPVCLWQESTDLSSVVNKEGTVVGWGFDQTGKVTETLLQVKMPVVSQLVCISFFNETDPALFSNSYCAGFRIGTSVCNGDTGEGMVFPRPGSKRNALVWQLRGLVSIGVGSLVNFDCDTSQYAIFTDTAKYLDWIEKSMKI